MSGMKSLKKQRRVQILGISGICVVAVLAILWFLPDDSFQFYRAPVEVVSAPPPEREVFRMGGIVVEGSLQQIENAGLRFEVSDGTETIPVVYSGSEAPPPLFEECEATVVTGRYVNGVFEATVILAKHDESYVPEEVAETIGDAEFCGRAYEGPAVN